MRKVQKQTRAVAVRQPAPVAVAPGVDGLLAMAIDKNFDADKLEKLINLKNSEQARMAKEDYERHFQLMQAEYPVIRKSQEVKNNDGKKLYAFCPLENIIALFGPLMSKHGFSWRWEKEAISDKCIRIISIIAGFGHDKRAYSDMPVIPPQNRATNEMQQVGITESYGRRYSIIANLGIVIAGEDTDAQPVKGVAEPQAKAGHVVNTEGVVVSDLSAVQNDVQGLYREMKKSGMFTLAEISAFSARASKSKHDQADLQNMFVEMEAELDSRNAAKKG